MNEPCECLAPGEGRNRFPGTGVVESCELLCGLWKLNLHPREEQCVLFTTERLYTLVSELTLVHLFPNTRRKSSAGKLCCQSNLHLSTDMLGTRLEQEGGRALTSEARLCYVCSGSVDRLVESWAKCQPASCPVALQVPLPCRVPTPLFPAQLRPLPSSLPSSGHSRRLGETSGPDMQVREVSHMQIREK